MKRIEENGKAAYDLSEELEAMRNAGFTEEQIEAVWNLAYSIAYALQNK